MRERRVFPTVNPQAVVVLHRCSALARPVDPVCRRQGEMQRGDQRFVTSDLVVVGVAIKLAANPTTLIQPSASGSQ
jgi:hypothetical protein